MAEVGFVSSPRYRGGAWRLGLSCPDMSHLDGTDVCVVYPKVSDPVIGSNSHGSMIERNGEGITTVSPLAKLKPVLLTDVERHTVRSPLREALAKMV